ncbi:MAG TPA: hypothetical protein VE289_03945 [Gaiellaceae bacterium]|nr:hypothetical protein [Gaiellaceae bacterium]
MIGLGAIPDVSFFSFHEVADMNIAAQCSTRTEMGKRANNRTAIDSTTGQDNGKSQMNLVAQVRVGQIGAAVNAASLTKHCRAA